MKRLILCTIVLISLMPPASACGPYYPYGEDVRFSILDPAAFGYKDFSGFNYWAGIFYSEDYTAANEEAGRAQNILLWKTYCRNKVDTASIYKAIYVLNEDEWTGNAMIDYLLKVKDTAAISYLKFAKRCNELNTWLDDPWERNNEGDIKTRQPFINQALNAISTLKNKILQKRYAFLAIRLSFYNGDEKVIKNLYSRYFEPKKTGRDIVDYWALYFHALLDTNQVRQNYNLALVFSNAPDKRFAVVQHYNKKVPLNSILALAKNNKERVAVCLMYNLNNVGPGLSALQTIYQLQPNSNAFGFLLLREINKLEDWIYTPYYTYFEPSVQSIYSAFNYDSEIKDRSKFALVHLERDKQYAEKLLQFVSSLNSSKIKDPQLIKTVKAYLQLMTNQYAACLNTIKTIPQLVLPAQIIKALCMVSMQTGNNCKIPGQIKSLIMQQAQVSNNKFLFAIAREVEYKGNTTEAALLYSKLNSGDDWKNRMYWRTKKNYNTLWLDFYEDYFFYLDAEYNTSQTKDLIASINNYNETRKKNSFDEWAYSNVRKDIGRLNDLLGTKYIRLNKLNEAYTAFKQVDDSVWSSPDYYYETYLDANPFYTNFYTEHQSTKADTVSFTKTGITARLIDYLQKADDKNNPKRDYYYFLAANCYFNMTHHGNSWMMKRYYWSSYEAGSHLPDDKEYHQANLARQYYLKAKTVTKHPQFAALCLRMAGRCEKYRQWDINIDTDSTENKYYKEIKTKYPDDFENLMSNCYSFDKYFAMRQNQP